VHHGVREIIESSSVIEVQMGKDDVTHVVCVKPELLDLANGCHFFAQLGPEQAQKKRTQARTRVTDIA
jgi:hypothetical protein